MSARGESHYAAKLSEADVLTIIARANRGDPLVAIARDFPKVSKVAVFHAMTGRTWAHIGGRRKVKPRKLGRHTTADLRDEFVHRGFKVIPA